MKPLRTKLLINNVLTVVISFVIFGILVTYAIGHLSSTLSSFNQERARAEKTNLESVSNENIQRIQEIYGTALESKGRKLLQKDSASLMGMIEDNSFNDLRGFLEKNFRDDGDIIGASYFVQEHGEIKAWQLISRLFPKGLGLPIEYDRKSASWRGTGPGGHPVRVDDPEVVAALNLNVPSVILKKLKMTDNNGRVAAMQVYDCVIPIFKRGSRASDIAAARKRGETIGYLRYVLSLERMEKSIFDQRKGLEASLEQAQAENERYANEAKSIMAALLTKLFILMGIGVIFILLLAYGISWVASSRVTQPVIELTRVAKRMAAGEYEQEIHVESDDEIGILANTFREMGGAITKRDEEIRRAERQLSEIFAAVPVGIISVGPGGLVGGKYSGYTEWLLNAGKIEGLELKNLLFAKGFDHFSKEAQECIDGIPALFGKSELHYKMAEFFLPTQIHFMLPPKNPDKERYIGLIYQPIFIGDNLARLLVVLEDRTAVVKAKLEVEEAHLQEDKSVLRLMQIKKASPESLPKLMAEISDLMERLRSNVEARDETQVRMGLHSIKGNSRILGLPFLAELVHGIEMKNGVDDNAGKSLDWSMVSTQLDGVSREWRELHGLYLAVTGGTSGSRDEVGSITSPEVVTLVRQLLLKLARTDVPVDSDRIQLALRATQCIQLSDHEGVIRLRASETARLLKREVEIRFDYDPGILVDRVASQVYSESLLHLVNNALSHGIGTPDLREQNGKPRKGLISIKVTERDGFLACEVSDDGDGIHVEAIKTSAVNKGMITLAQAKSLSRDEALNLIFKAGVSSKKVADMVSGLGIGMNTVRDRIESLGGKIQVLEASDKGTRFSFTIRSLGQLGQAFVRVRTSDFLAQVSQRVAELQSRDGLPVLVETANQLVAGVDSSRGFFGDSRSVALSASTLIGHFSLENGPIIFSVGSTGGKLILQARVEKDERAVESNLGSFPEFVASLELCQSCIRQHEGEVHRHSNGLEIVLPLASMV